MAVLNDEWVRLDVIDQLRDMAARGVGLSDMVQSVQKELGFAPEMIVPVIGHFCRAFSLPLRIVLPLREWPENRNDPEIGPLLDHLKSLKSNDEQR